MVERHEQNSGFSFREKSVSKKMSNQGSMLNSKQSKMLISVTLTVLFWGWFV